MGKKILVTGGAGFIGANFVYYVLSRRPDWHIVNLDALTYAGNLLNLKNLSPEQQNRHTFVHGDIKDQKLLSELFQRHKFNGVVHFAAESHVDRSITGPMAFVDTNVGGTCELLQAGLAYWRELGESSAFRFHHVSTDEVYGSLGDEGSFSEDSSYDPSSPYSASKAASDHFVRAYHRTYGLPVVITNCSNNYGPYQFPEKLIPLMILNCVAQKPLPVYGKGKNIRDWLYVPDHCEAILRVFEMGADGETYNIGGGRELTNIDIVRKICAIVDDRLEREQGTSEELITFVRDRPGHDYRYAINAEKIKKKLNWQPAHTFNEALAITIDWYLANSKWVDSIRSGEYRQWLELNYAQR